MYHMTMEPPVLRGELSRTYIIENHFIGSDDQLEKYPVAPLYRSLRNISGNILARPPIE